MAKYITKNNTFVIFINDTDKSYSVHHLYTKDSKFKHVAIELADFDDQHLYDKNCIIKGKFTKIFSNNDCFLIHIHDDNYIFFGAFLKAYTIPVELTDAMVSLFRDFGLMIW